MQNLVYTVQRILFGQPWSVTRAVMRARLRRRSQSTGENTASVHPIDVFYGIETSGVISPGRIRSGSRSDVYSIGYGGAQPSVLRHVFGLISGVETACFLDLGCGKGRALAVATEFRFYRILGVELSPALTQIAARNATILAERNPDRTAIEILQGDALKFDLPGGDLVVFLYNPGYGPLVRGIAARLAAHQACSPDRLFIIYCNPILASVFDGYPEFERYYAGQHPLGVDDLANYGERENSIVIWKARSDKRSNPLPGATARVRAGDAHAEIEMTQPSLPR